MPEARMKKEKKFLIKCDNKSKFQVMKKGSHNTTIGKNLLDAFKEKNTISQARG